MMFSFGRRSRIDSDLLCSQDQRLRPQSFLQVLVTLESTVTAFAKQMPVTLD